MVWRTSETGKAGVSGGRVVTDGEGWARLWVRSLTLYPAELRAQSAGGRGIKGVRGGQERPRTPTVPMPVAGQEGAGRRPRLPDRRHYCWPLQPRTIETISRPGSGIDSTTIHTSSQPCPECNAEPGTPQLHTAFYICGEDRPIGSVGATDDSVPTKRTCFPSVVNRHNRSISLRVVP